jgi:SAM-dependent methyltransferase
MLLNERRMSMGNEVREQVKQHYGELARRTEEGRGGFCCSCGTCSDSPISNARLLYEAENLSGLPEEAVSFSLGCANPLVLAGLKDGEVVLDLGSGGGLDVLAASKHVGSEGKVYGLDMTDDMLAVANKNKERMGVTNVEFLKGYIEDIPLPDESVDVIISNCVINLSEDKERVLYEAYRVLKPGGRLAVADMVTLKDVPPGVRKIAELWCGCLAGTLAAPEYRRILEKVGFKDVDIEPVHVISKSLIAKLIQGHREASAVESIDLDAIDGAFAGANVRASK